MLQELRSTFVGGERDGDLGEGGWFTGSALNSWLLGCTPPRMNVAICPIRNFTEIPSDLPLTGEGWKHALQERGATHCEYRATGSHSHGAGQRPVQTHGTC